MKVKFIYRKIMLVISALVTVLMFTSCPGFESYDEDLMLFEGTYSLPSAYTAGSPVTVSDDSIHVWNAATGKISYSYSIERQGNNTLRISRHSVIDGVLWFEGSCRSTNLYRFDLRTGELKGLDRRVIPSFTVENVFYFKEALNSKGAVVFLSHGKFSSGKQSGYENMLHVFDLNGNLIKNCLIDYEYYGWNGVKNIVCKDESLFIAPSVVTDTDNASQQQLRIIKIPLDQAGFTTYTVPYDSIFPQALRESCFEAFVASIQNYRGTAIDDDLRPRILEDIESSVPSCTLISEASGNGIYLQCSYYDECSFLVKLEGIGSEAGFSSGNQVFFLGSGLEGTEEAVDALWEKNGKLYMIRKYNYADTQKCYLFNVLEKYTIDDTLSSKTAVKSFSDGTRLCGLWGINIQLVNVDSETPWVFYESYYTGKRSGYMYRIDFSQGSGDPSVMLFDGKADGIAPDDSSVEKSYFYHYRCVD